MLVVGLVASWAASLGGARTRAPAIQLHKTKLGEILVASNGYTIYDFTKDRRNVDVCIRSAPCIASWPVVSKKAGQPLAGPGVKVSLIGTITLKGGIRQLTYAGHPLYTYAGDSHPAQTNFVNLYQFGGRWPALNAAGHEIK